MPVSSVAVAPATARLPRYWLTSVTSASRSGSACSVSHAVAFRRVANSTAAAQFGSTLWVAARRPRNMLYIANRGAISGELRYGVAGVSLGSLGYASVTVVVIGSPPDGSL